MCIGIRLLLVLLVLNSVQSLCADDNKNERCYDIASADTIQLYAPYMAEPLPPNAPLWMKGIADSPGEVNFYEMQRLFNEWTSQNVDARV